MSTITSTKTSHKGLFGSLGFAVFFIGPAILFTVFVVVIPMVYSFYLSFTNFNLLSPGKIAWVGLQNYIELVQSRIFWSSFGRTVLFMALAVNIETVLGLILAILLVKPVKGQRILRTALMVPMMFPPILIGFQFKWLYNDQVGMVNNLVTSITGTTFNKAWLIEVPWGFLSVLSAEVWMGTPFMAIIMIAGLVSLPHDPFEAADIDGASAWQKFYYITRPLLMPYILIATIIRSLDIGRAYDIVKIMTNGGPAQRTELIWTYVSRLGLVDNRFALGTAMSFITVVVAFAFTIFIYRSLVKVREGNL